MSHHLKLSINKIIIKILKDLCKRKINEWNLILSGSGFPFGEVALVSDDAVRTATIIAEEETDLLVVDRALYNRAVRDVLAEEFEEKQHFIKTNDLFKSWIPKYKKQLTMAMYKETFPYDSVLVKQGDAVGNIYFIVRFVNL
jgi:hypothetical protein